MSSSPSLHIDSQDDGGAMVAFIDPSTKEIIECNDNFVETTKFKKPFLIGRNVFSLCPKQCQHSALKVFKTFLKGGTVIDADLKLKKQDGGSIPVTLRISGSPDNHGRVRCAKFSWHNISKRKKFQETLVDGIHQLDRRLVTRTKDLEKAKQTIRKEVQKRKSAQSQIAQALKLLKSQHRKLQGLAGRLISIQEDERRRLSRELHDDTCQKLAMIAFQADSLVQRHQSSSPILTEELRSLHQQITAVAGEIRNLSHLLHPSILEHLGLVQSIKAYIEEVEKRENLAITFTHRNIHKDLPFNISLCLYRVIQECLGNIAKHAQTQGAWITLIGFPKSVRVSIQDKGNGISNKKLKSIQQGLGFVSMVERTRLVKGKLQIQSKVKGGTQIVLRIPWSTTQS